MTTNDEAEWTYDPEARAGYLRLRRGDVKSSESAGDRIVVDSGGHGETLGIEVLSSVDAALLDTWLARVRRDAAREALDGLAKSELDRVTHISKYAYPAQIAQGIAQAAWNHKWRHYGGAHPEEEA